MREILFVFIWCTLAYDAVWSQYFSYTNCPQTSSAPPVNLTRYVEFPWYYIYLFDNFLEKGDSCSREDLKIRSDGNVDKTTTALYNNQKRTIYGIAEINNSGNGGVLTIYLINGLPFTHSFPYVILATDYDNYAVAYSCAPYFWGGNIQFSWILSRQRTLSITSFNEVKAILVKNNITGPYLPQNQLNCPSNL